MNARCLASSPSMLPSPRLLPRSLRTELPAVARQPLQTCTGRTGSGSLKRVAPSADPLPADLPHRGPRARVAARSGSGRALPHFPRSKARPGLDHVAVVLALGRAPSSAVVDEAGVLFQHFSFPVAPCPSKGSPRQQPCRVAAALALSPADCASLPATRVATGDGVGAARRPQGLAPLSSSLSSSMLPSRATRSFLGLAYLQDFSPVSRMRNVVLVLT